MVTRVPRFSASLREPCTPIRGWKPAAATVVHGPALPSGLAGLRVHATPGCPNSARRRETRHGARATASPEDSYRACTCARAPFSVSSGSLGASSTPNESSRRAARAHAKDAGHLGLLLRRVQVKAALLRVLLQQASRSPPTGDRGRLFLHGPVSCIHSVVHEQRQHEERSASSFLRTMCSCRCRGACAAGGDRRARRGIAAARGARVVEADGRHVEHERAAHRPRERRCCWPTTFAKARMQKMS